MWVKNLVVVVSFLYVPNSKSVIMRDVLREAR